MRPTERSTVRLTFCASLVAVGLCGPAQAASVRVLLVDGVAVDAQDKQVVAQQLAAELAAVGAEVETRQAAPDCLSRAPCLHRALQKHDLGLTLELFRLGPQMQVTMVVVEPDGKKSRQYLTELTQAGEAWQGELLDTTLRTRVAAAPPADPAPAQTAPAPAPDERPDASAPAPEATAAPAEDPGQSPAAPEPSPTAGAPAAGGATNPGLYVIAGGAAAVAAGVLLVVVGGGMAGWGYLVRNDPAALGDTKETAQLVGFAGIGMTVLAAVVGLAGAGAAGAGAYLAFGE